MEGKSNAKLYYLFAIICGTWFLCTSWFWSYGGNLIVSYPVAAIGIFLWMRGKKLNPGNKANIIALSLFIGGFVISMISLVVYLVFN